MDQVKASLQEVTKQQLFNIASANLSAEASLALARDMGILNEESYGAYTIMQSLDAQYQAGKISSAEYAAQVAALGSAIAGLQDKTVTVTTKFVNEGGSLLPGQSLPEGEYLGGKPGETKGYASGGSFMIPPGYPNDSYPLGPGVRQQPAAVHGRVGTQSEPGAGSGRRVDREITWRISGRYDLAMRTGRRCPS